MKKPSLTKQVTDILCQKYRNAVKAQIMRHSEAAMSSVDAPKLARDLVRIGRKAKMSDDEILKSVSRPVSPGRNHFCQPNDDDRKAAK